MSNRYVKKRRLLTKLTITGIAIGLCIVFLFSFAGGGGKKAEEVTINVLTVQDPFYFGMELSIPTFEEKTGITVNLEALAYDALHAKIITSFVGKKAGVDVVTVDQMWLSQYADNNWILDLTPYIDKDKEEELERIGRMIRSKILPDLEDIRNTLRSERSKARLDAITHHMNALISRKRQSIKTLNSLTPTEMIIASMIVNDLTSDEIAQTLAISEEQKVKHRETQREAQKELQQKTQEFYRKVRQEALDKVLSVLTAEQRKKLDDMMGEDYEP